MRWIIENADANRYFVLNFFFFFFLLILENTTCGRHRAFWYWMLDIILYLFFYICAVYFIEIICWNAHITFYIIFIYLFFVLLWLLIYLEMVVFRTAINFVFYSDRRSRLSAFFFSRDTQNICFLIE